MAAIRPNRPDDRGERDEDAYRKVPNRGNELPNRTNEASSRMSEIPNRTNEIPDRLSQASKENPKAKDYITKDEVNRQVLQDNICRYLGRDAYCVPDYHEKTKELWGYFIVAPRPFTTAMLEDLRQASREFAKERTAYHKRTDGDTLPYEKSQTYERTNMTVEYGDNRKPYAGRDSPSFSAATGGYGVPPALPPQTAYPPTSGSYVISGAPVASPMPPEGRYPAPEYKSYPPQASRNEARDPRELRDPRSNMQYADPARHVPVYNDQHMTGGYNPEPGYARAADPRDARSGQQEYYPPPGNGDHHRADPRDLRPSQPDYYGSSGNGDVRMGPQDYYGSNGAQYGAPVARDPRDTRESRMPEGYYSNNDMQGLSGPRYDTAPGRNTMSPQYEPVGRQDQYRGGAIDRGYRS